MECQGIFPIKFEKKDIKNNIRDCSIKDAS